MIFRFIFLKAMLELNKSVPVFCCKPLGVTQKEFAEHLGWTYARLNEIINGRRGVTAESALAIGDALKTGPEFWLNLQRNWDLWQSMRHHKKVPPLKKAG